MKAIKIAGKIIGWVIGGYLILNTLCWAQVGMGYAGRELRDAKDNNIQNKVSYVQQRVLEDAADGWSWIVSIFKTLFECIAEDIKDAF